jgi:hypothetical protein
MRMLRASVFVVSALLGACNAGGGGGGGGGDTDASATPDVTVGNDTGGGNDATMGGDRAPTGDGPNCGAGSANCGACTPLPSCGWCRRTNSCVPGNSMGATAGGCMGADWAYLPSQCGGDGGTPGDAAPPNCSAGTMGCAACAPLPGCGWCRRTNSCVPGSSMGSTTGGCMGADWAYLPSQCGGDGGTGDGGASCASGVPRSCNLTLSGAARTCTAGQMVRVGCNQGCGLGSCTGDAVMQICPGNATTPCAMAIASNDDAPDSAMCTMGPDGGAGSDLCPLVTFMCPADGRYTVWVGAFGSGMATCMAAVR